MLNFWCIANTYKRDLLDSVNSMLQPYRLLNISNALSHEIFLYGDKKLLIDSNSEIFKAILIRSYECKLITNFGKIIACK